MFSGDHLSARAHYKPGAIHPFDDGNGRVARLLMNLILMKYGCAPVVIKQENRENYYKALMKADAGEMDDFIQLLAAEERNSLRLILDIIEKHIEKRGRI